MMQSRRASTLLEILVCLTILALLSGVVSLSALRPAPLSTQDAATLACTTAAARGRKAITADVERGFIVCQPDGRYVMDGVDYLTSIADK